MVLKKVMKVKCWKLVMFYGIIFNNEIFILSLMNASVSHCLNEAFVVALDGVWNRFLATIYVCFLTCTIVIIFAAAINIHWSFRILFLSLYYELTWMIFPPFRMNFFMMLRMKMGGLLDETLRGLAPQDR